LWWGTPRPEWTLNNIVPIVRAVPDAKYLILNVANNIRLNDEDMALFSKTEVVFDTSGRQVNSLPDLLKSYGGKSLPLALIHRFLTI